MEIRLATAADAHELARMRYDFRAGQNEPVETREAFASRCAPWIAAHLGSESAWRCWVAVDGAAIAGHLWLQIIEKIPNPAPELESHAYITNVYVDPAARGSGLGAKLMEAALAFCREARVDSVILWPTERSRTLYARHGFQLPEDMLEATLDDGRDLH